MSTMSEASTVPDTALSPYRAIDALNSFVRSKAFSRQYMGRSEPLRKHVYEMKNEAIRQAHAAGLTDHRRVRITAQCRGCGGTGLYVDREGCEHDHCWDCSSTGTVKLRFIETTIAGVGAWHTPSLRFPYLISQSLSWPQDLSSQEYADSWTDVSGTWTVNQPGRDIEPAEVAEHLVAAEAEFYWPLYHCAPKWTVTSLQEQAAYRLFIGALDAACYFCQEPRILGREKGLCNTVNWVPSHKELNVFWRIAVCDQCSKLHEREFLDSSLLPFPHRLASPPAIRQWLGVRASLTADTNTAKEPVA